MNRPIPLLLLPLLLAMATGCGPIRSTVGIIEAEQVLKEARELGLSEQAPYPIALAEALVRKAIEEQGYADYSTSWQLATEARDLVRATLAELPDADGPSPEPIEPANDDEGVYDPTAAEPGRRVVEDDDEVDPLLEAAEEALRQEESEEAAREFEEPEEEEPESEEPEQDSNPWLDEPEETP